MLVFGGKIQESTRLKRNELLQKELALLIISKNPFVDLSQSFPSTLQIKLNYIQVVSI
jgi:hypothetical protein